MRKKKSKVPPEHAFGPAYGQWLNQLESFEDFVSGRISMKKTKTFAYDNDTFFFPEDPEKSFDVYMSLVHIWGGDAQNLRNSFKFKVGQEEYVDFLIANKSAIEITTYLPFENVYIQYEYGEDEHAQLMLLCERRTLDRDYPELALLEGDTFICITPAAFNKDGLPGDSGQKLCFYPVEIHLLENVCWRVRGNETDSTKVVWAADWPEIETPPFIECFPGDLDGEVWTQKHLSRSYVHAFFATLAMLSCGGVKQTTLGRVRPENVIRRKPAHKKQHPMYEYKVLELGLGGEEPIVNVQISRESAKKRLHAVRGFWRTYKEPLKSGRNKGKTKVFVKGHWRGDKELGVIKKDYVFTTDEDKE
ncbi:MAG: hypothetical protein CMF29_01095 [Kiritimatiellaceae bacterium]|nr:hypothetical protein [Kiritimatiellaceae bacterium]|tara:strand:- start:2083 stop:3165 length:1083 start_codon:yes stop_codon:yes gene_type:complete